MATLEEMTTALRNAFERRNAGDASLKFNLKDDGFIYIRGKAVTNEDLPADCTITVSKSDLENILGGELDARECLVNGLMVIHGDVGVAMEMQAIIASAW
jgi:putative sterol carrier protein